MNQNVIARKNIISKIVDYAKNNLRIIITFLSVCFVLFLIFQFFIYYSLNKIQNNSITFFNSQNFEDKNIIQESILELSEENNFYGILSKLELIEINISNQNYQYVIDMYKKLLENKNLDNVYKSAIASRASYQFVDLNLTDLSKNYSEIIEFFISFIDDELISYKGLKLELNYLTKILEAEKNNIKYINYNEAVDLYTNIMNSDYASSVTKERVNKIHEFFSYK